MLSPVLPIVSVSMAESLKKLGFSGMISDAIQAYLLLAHYSCSFLIKPIQNSLFQPQTQNGTWRCQDPFSHCVGKVTKNNPNIAHFGQFCS